MTVKPTNGRASANTPVALVTGAARRVGAAIATALHRRGMHVAIHYRSSHDAALDMAASFNARRPHSAIIVPGDIAEVAVCQSIVHTTLDAFGRLDVLVNNASTFYPTALDTLSEQHWNDLMGSNLKGPLFLSAAATDYLKTTGGCIVNITDIHAQHPLRGHTVYCAAKAGLETLTRALARDLAPRVRVNAIAPGAILWPDSSASNDATAIIEGTELKRLGAPSDIAQAVCYLALDAPYVTGHTLTVDGGRTIGP